MDIFVEEEVQQLELEIENQKMALALQEKDKLLSIARKVAHDICSPLTVLKMMVQSCNELPPEKIKLLNSATESILEIANHMLNSYRNEKHQACEPSRPLLIADLIRQVISEKKIQFQKHEVTFETNIDTNANFAVIQMQKTEFNRMMSNLINNAVDALEDKNDGKVIVNLSADTNSVVIQIVDNGKGMLRDQIEKVLGCQSFTEGKLGGHGLGLQQVWDTLEHNQGSLAVHSKQNIGTCVQLTFRL